MDSVTAAGFELAYDWLAEIVRIGAGNAELTDEQRLSAAFQCEYGVLTSDLVWMLAPEAYSAGSWWEAAYAFSKGIQVLISGPAARRNIYGAFVLEAETDTEALNMLPSLLGER